MNLCSHNLFVGAGSGGCRSNRHGVGGMQTPVLRGKLYEERVLVTDNQGMRKTNLFIVLLTDPTG